MKKNLTILFGAFLALALLASACGGSDEASAEDQAVIDAVAAQIRADGDIPEVVDVDCMAAGMVNGLGGAQVMEDTYGLTAATIAAGQEPDDAELSVDSARSMADDMMGCGLEQVMVDAIAGEGLSEDDSSCLLDNVDQDAIRDIFAAEFMSGADADRIGEAAEDSMGLSLLSAVAECDIDPSSIGF